MYSQSKLIALGIPIFLSLKKFLNRWGTPEIYIKKSMNIPVVTMRAFMPLRILLCRKVLFQPLFADKELGWQRICAFFQMLSPKKKINRMFVCLFIWLFKSNYLTASKLFCLFFYMAVCLSVFLSTYLYVYIFLSNCLSTYLYICIAVSQSICLSTFL